MMRRTTQLLERVVLQSDHLRVEVIPAAGGQIAWLGRADGSNLLYEPRASSLAPRVPGMRFDEGDASGFDECFPSVAPAGAVPDHGELWTAPWELERLGPLQARMSVLGPFTGARFERTLELRDNVLRLEYRVEAGATGAIDYLWSAHPLFRVMRGSRIVLPPEVEHVAIEYSHSGRVVGRDGARCGWPRAGQHQLDELLGPELREAEKLFAGPMRQGWAILRHPNPHPSVAIHFDPVLTPWLGLWICQGGWPRPRQDFTVALEPCTAPTDSLDQARARGLARHLSAEKAHRWWLELCILDTEVAR